MGNLRLDLLVKRSQISLNELKDLLSEFFDLRNESGLWESWVRGSRSPRTTEVLAGGGPFLKMKIPIADKKGKGRIEKWLSRFSSPIYRLRLTKLVLEDLIAMIDRMEEEGLEIGFIERQGGKFSFLKGEIILWPDSAEARLTTAKRLYRLSKETEHEPFIDVDFFILSLRNITRRKLRTIFLVSVLSLVCGNFIYHIRFSIGGEGVAVVVPAQWELPLAAGLMALITFMNLMEISLHERKMEIGTIRALGAETTTVMLIFASEGMILGALGAASGYLMVIIAAVSIKFSGISPGLDLVAAAGPGKGILGLFLGFFIGIVGTVPLIFPMLWRAPDDCL